MPLHVGSQALLNVAAVAAAVMQLLLRSMLISLRLEQRLNYIQNSSFDQKRPRSILYRARRCLGQEVPLQGIEPGSVLGQVHGKLPGTQCNILTTKCWWSRGVVLTSLCSFFFSCHHGRLEHLHCCFPVFAPQFYDEPLLNNQTNKKTRRPKV